MLWMIACVTACPEYEGEGFLSRFAEIAMKTVQDRPFLSLEERRTPTGLPKFLFRQTPFCSSTLAVFEIHVDAAPSRS
jgi:hypothetical protein